MESPQLYFCLSRKSFRLSADWSSNHGHDSELVSTTGKLQSPQGGWKNAVLAIYSLHLLVASYLDSFSYRVRCGKFGSLCDDVVWFPRINSWESTSWGSERRTPSWCPWRCRPSTQWQSGFSNIHKKKGQKEIVSKDSATADNLHKSICRC
jgi:hypothetical protein